jgi:hypothetical protein
VRPQQFHVSSFFPEVSSDERFIADSMFRQFEIREAQSHRQVATWLVPPFPSRGIFHGWRPGNGREVIISGRHGSSLGTWIFDMSTGAALRMIDGPTTQTRWSPDGSKMALALGQPYWEIWIAQLDPKQSTIETFGVPRTVEEHCKEQIACYSRGVATDPNCLDAHLRRTEAALWIDDANAPQYLEELERAFRCVPYHAGGCDARARAILSGPHLLRERLRPLGLLLAQLAAEKRRDSSGHCRYDPETSCYTIAGIGGDIWEVYDDFHFAHKVLHGDGSITARIDSLEYVHEWSKAGLMIRNGLDATAKNVTILVTPTGIVTFQYRHTKADVTYSKNTPPQTAQLPHWLRLTREGNRFIAEHCTDGVNWQNVLSGSDPNQPPFVDVQMGETVQIGLAVTSHDVAKSVETHISSVCTTGSVLPDGPFDHSKDIRFTIPPLLDDINRNK